MADPHSVPAVRATRERTIARLCEHFAHDHLEAEELERLIDRAHAATTQAELDALLAALPALPPRAAPGSAPQARPAEHRTDRELVVTVMGGAARKGSWAPARSITVVAVMGGVSLDFRSAHLPLGVTEVRVFAMMGGVQIIVPPGVHVDSSGIGIMGGFDHGGRRKLPVDQSAPVLRITGLALMGGVEVRERLPGESARERLRGGRRELGSGEGREA